jgi:hypothetical protein
MPSPTSKRTKADHLAAGGLDELGRRTGRVLDEGLLGQAVLGQVLRRRPSTIFSAISAGLPAMSGWARMISFSLSSCSWPACPRGDHLRIDRRDVHGDVLGQVLRCRP